MQTLVPVVLGTVTVLGAGTASAQAPAAPPPPQVAYGAPISLEQAKKMVVGAEAESVKNKWNMVITILDSGGNVVLTHRMDGAQLGSIETARAKAMSAVLYRRPSKVFEDLVAQGGPNLRLLQLPGAIGVSGAASAQDGQAAKAGIDALK